MGFNNNQVSPEQTQANALADEQISKNLAELEERRKSLFAERLQIIKSQGAENWHTTTMNPVTYAPTGDKPLGKEVSKNNPGKQNNSLLGTLTTGLGYKTAITGIGRIASAIGRRF